MRTNRNEFTNRAQVRLQKLVSSREVIDKYDPPSSNLIDPPAISIRPIASLGLGFVAVLAIFVWTQLPTPVPTTQVLNQGISMATPTLNTELVVDVEGEVNKPGLAHLPVGSRMADAIQAAQGIKPGVDSTTLNLAARLDDGQLIVVGQSNNNVGTTDARVSLNQGTVADFDSLPGVGPVLAGRIAAYRDQHQHFSSIDQLQEVPGIGPKVFQNLKPLIKL